MNQKHSGYIPKEMFQMLVGMEQLHKIPNWKMNSPKQIKMNFTMYYEGGQWRNFIVYYNLETFDYLFSCTYYFPENRSVIGEEITKAEWDSKGYCVSTSKNAASEIIEPNDIKVLEWLKSKGVLLKITYENAIIITKDYLDFEHKIREYIASGTAYDKQEADLLIQERLGVSHNIKLFYKYLDKNPTSKILNMERPTFKTISTLNDLKTNQVDPKYIYTVKNIFFGVVNVNAI